MSAYGFVFPVQPGKESIIREMGDYLRSHSAEYAESRRRVGLTVERAYLQRNPDGSTLVVAYGVGDRPPSQVMEAYLASDLPLDRMFIDRNSEATGIDFRAAARGPAPEQVAEWTAPGANGRKRGFAFAAPLAPGKTEAARAFAREAYQARRAELTESRLAQGVIREEVFLNQTPAGDVVVVYVEGDDPIEGNRRFAASQAPYDRWFKDRCREIFPPFVDFDKPVPANEEVFSWVAG